MRCNVLTRERSVHGTARLDSCPRHMGGLLGIDPSALVTWRASILIWSRLDVSCTVVLDRCGRVWQRALIIAQQSGAKAALDIIVDRYCLLLGPYATRLACVHFRLATDLQDSARYPVL